MLTIRGHQSRSRRKPSTGRRSDGNDRSSQFTGIEDEPIIGDMRQIGIVVRDVEAAMRHWVEVCGIGPWFYAERLPVTAFTYAGQRYDNVHCPLHWPIREMCSSN